MLRSWHGGTGFLEYADERTAHDPLDPSTVTSTRTTSRCTTRSTPPPGSTAVAVSMKRALEQMGAEPHRADPAQAQPGRGLRLHELRLARPGRRATGTPPSSARTAPRRWPRRPPRPARPRSSSPRTASPTWTSAPSTGSASRAGSPSRWSSAPGATHYAPIELGRRLRADRRRAAAAWRSPDEAIFYTSGRASNEAAFAYQLFARAFGTNNLPDCSNMCHESTSIALAGVDRHRQGQRQHRGRLRRQADLIVAGQNPGTNHPRMLSALEIAKQNGAKIVSINPLREAGLVRFKNPQTPARRRRQGHRARRPAPADQDQRRPGAVPGDRLAAGASGTRSTTTSSTGTPSASSAWAAHVSAVDWDAGRPRPPA